MSADLIAFPSLLTDRQAADRLGVSIDTVRRERRRGRIGFTMIAGRPRYTERHLLDYVAAGEVQPCVSSRATNTRLADTGSASAQAVRPGAAHDSISGLDRRAAQASALAILRPQKSRLPGG